LTSTSDSWTETDRARQVSNVLGALVLALSDRLEEAVVDAAGQSENSGAALSALYHFLEAPRIELLAQVLGLSHSGAVRLVDRLESDGYVRRRTGDDGRVTLVELTAAGRRRGEAITSSRTALFEDALSPLSDDERIRLGVLVGKVLGGLVRTPGATRWTCRLCDVGRCGRALGHCPAYEAAKARHGTA
jgi:DNA-binding MarR family transcriptional regulator